MISFHEIVLLMSEDDTVNTMVRYFEQAAVHLDPVTRMGRLSRATLRAIPKIQARVMQVQPQALLCSNDDNRWMTVRRSIQAQYH
jgi:hypothetical protein